MGSKVKNAILQVGKWLHIMIHKVGRKPIGGSGFPADRKGGWDGCGWSKWLERESVETEITWCQNNLKKCGIVCPHYGGKTSHDKGFVRNIHMAAAHNKYHVAATKIMYKSWEVVVTSWWAMKTQIEVKHITKNNM